MHGAIGNSDTTSCNRGRVPKQLGLQATGRPHLKDVSMTFECSASARQQAPGSERLASFKLSSIKHAPRSARWITPKLPMARPGENPMDWRPPDIQRAIRRKFGDCGALRNAIPQAATPTRPTSFLSSLWVWVGAWMDG